MLTEFQAFFAPPSSVLGAVCPLHIYLTNVTFGEYKCEPDRQLVSSFPTSFFPKYFSSEPHFFRTLLPGKG